MTDIYDFRRFYPYRDIWDEIHKTIYKLTNVQKKTNDNIIYYNYLKKNKPYIWTNCDKENIILEMIERSVQISYHELVYLPTKSDSKKWNIPSPPDNNYIFYEEYLD